MLTRSQVARRLGKSIATVRRMEGVALHPQRDARGVQRFDPHEVERVARGRSALVLPKGLAELNAFLRGAASSMAEDDDEFERATPRKALVSQPQPAKPVNGGELEVQRQALDQARTELRRTRRELEEARSENAELKRALRVLEDALLRASGIDALEELDPELATLLDELVE